MVAGKNFVIYTRGRSGSSVIVSQLDSHPDVVCYNELFHPNGRSIWNEGLSQFGRSDFPHYLVFKDKKDKKKGEQGPENYYGSYLRRMTEFAREQHSAANVGFKLLTHQARSHKSLMEVLKRQDFVFLHLIRRNIVRQVISAMVARQRGVWNRRSWTAPDERYRLDMLEFSKKISISQNSTDKNIAFLKDWPIDHITIYYEDYVNEPRAFFDRVFDFLQISHIDLAPTDASIMTDRCLRNVVENYDELKDTTERLELSHMLEAP